MVAAKTGVVFANGRVHPNSMDCKRLCSLVMAPGVPAALRGCGAFRRGSAASNRQGRPSPHDRHDGRGIPPSFRPLSSNVLHTILGHRIRFFIESPLSCASARQRRGGKGRSWRTRFSIFWLNCNEFTPYEAAASSRLPCARPRRPDAPASLQRTSAQTLFFKEGAVFRDLLLCQPISVSSVISGAPTYQKLVGEPLGGSIVRASGRLGSC